MDLAVAVVVIRDQRAEAIDVLLVEKGDNIETCMTGTKLVPK